MRSYEKIKKYQYLIKKKTWQICKKYNAKDKRSVYLVLLMVQDSPTMFIFGLLLTRINGITQAAEVAHHRPNKLSACWYKSTGQLYVLSKPRLIVVFDGSWPIG